MSEEATLRFLNETAIREHALRCSKAHRAGKFTRVGDEFVQEVKVEVEAFVRDLRSNRIPTKLHDPLVPDDLCFTTGALMDTVQYALNRYIGRLIQNKVQSQTTGCTLKGIH